MIVLMKVLELVFEFEIDGILLILGVVLLVLLNVLFWWFGLL